MPELENEEIQETKTREGLEPPEGSESRENIRTPIEGPSEREMRNLLSVDSIRDEIQEKFVKILHRVRSNREAKIESDWTRYRNIYNLRRTTEGYEGRAKLFLPVLKDAVDTLTRTVKDVLLSEPYIAVETKLPQWKTVGVQFMKYLLEDQGKISVVLPMFLSQLFQLGTTCVKYPWVEEGKFVRFRERDEDGVSGFVKRWMISHYGPRLEVVDMSRVYVWPEDQTSYDGLRMIFEDTVTTLGEIKRKAKKGFYSMQAVETIMQKRQVALKELRQSKGQVIQEGIELNLDPTETDLTIMWVKMEINNRGYEEWLQCIVVDDQLIRIIENPWWFGTPNYRFATMFQEHDYFYGHGLIEAYETWQYMINDTANQTMDVATFTLNPIFLYDPEDVEDPDVFKMQPMAKWPLDPNKGRFERPPIDMAAQGLIMLRFLLNVVQEGTKATALVQGAPREGLGKATATATGVSQLFSAATAAIVDQAERVEEQALTPMIRDLEIMAHERLVNSIVLRITGPDGSIITDRVIDPDDLVLSTDVRWISGSRIRGKLAKTQQLINFSGVAMQIPEEETLKQGFVIDKRELIKDVYTSLGLENPDRIIKDITQSVPGIPPDIEEELMESGREVMASPLDTPEEHMSHINFHLRSPSDSDLLKARKQEHIASHFAAMQAALGGAAGAPLGEAGVVGGAPARGQSGSEGVPSRTNINERPQGEETGDGAVLRGLLSQVAERGVSQ